MRDHQGQRQPLQEGVHWNNACGLDTHHHVSVGIGLGVAVASRSFRTPLAAAGVVLVEAGVTVDMGTFLR